MNGTDFYSQAADWVVNTARRKPEALLLVAAGCALMMRSGSGFTSSWSRPSDNYARASWQDEATSTAREGVERTTEGATRYAGEMRDRLSETASGYASTVADYAQGARRRVGEYTGAVRENLSSATDQVTRNAQSAARSAADTLREQPLLIAALGLATGAAVAALFPATDIERRTLGPAGEALVGAAGAAGRDLMERAARTGEEVRRAAEDGLKDMAHEAAQSFTRGGEFVRRERAALRHRCVMTTLELDRLEDDVAKARERVVADVARLRSPAAVAEFKADIGHTVSDSAQRTLDGLKSRAAANPAAVLAIGAGLLWRFARHPPIASVLVGVGLASLMRTSPESPPSPVVTRTGEVLHAASERASELTEQAREFTAQARDTAAAAAARVSETAGRMADQASQAAARVTERGAQLSDQALNTAGRLRGEAGDAAARISGQAAEAAARMSEGAGQFASQAARSADRMTAAAQRALANGSARDTFLLGFAAVAVGAAAFLNYRRGEA